MSLDIFRGICGIRSAVGTARVIVGIGSLSVEKDMGRWRAVEVAWNNLAEVEGTGSITLTGRFRSLLLSRLESEELRLRVSSTSSAAGGGGLLRRKGEERRPAPDLGGGASTGASREFLCFAGEGERDPGSQDLLRSLEVNDWDTAGSEGVSVCSTSRCIAVFDVASLGRSLRRTSTRGFFSLISRGASVSGVESPDFAEEVSETFAEELARNPSREKPSKSPKELTLSSSIIESLVN